MSLPLFESVKDVADTSIEAYREIAPTLQHRESLVLGALVLYAQRHPTQPYPTAYELYEFMRGRALAFDLNSVRPRLTSLSKQRHLIARVEKRVCSVTHKTAWTWKVV